MAYAIETQDLTRDYGNVRAVDSLDLQVPERSVFGFLGPNGAGKTTTLNLLLGIVAPTRGTAKVAGLDVATQAGEVRRRCGALLEHNGLYERLSARDNLEFQARAYRMQPADREQRIRDVLDGMGLWERRDETVGKWSKGMKQQLAIARAMLPRPAIVFLDEPTAGHDPAAAAKLRDHLRDIVRNDGATVFLTTHNLHEAETVCDRVAVLREGRLVAVGPPDGLRRGRAAQFEIVGGPFPAAVVKAVLKLKGVAAASAKGGVLTVEMASAKAAAAPIVKHLVAAGVTVEEARPVRHSLEEDFLALVEAG